METKVLHSEGVTAELILFAKSSADIYGCLEGVVRETSRGPGISGEAACSTFAGSCPFGWGYSPPHHQQCISRLLRVAATSSV